MTEYLADGNVLVALTLGDHVHHERVIDWFVRNEPVLATCPITEGTLIRFLVREGRTVAEAIGVLDAMRARDWHRFWPADLAVSSDDLAGVVGHRQVTDAYLAALARRHGGRVVTLDVAMATAHSDVVDLVP